LLLERAGQGKEQMTGMRLNRQSPERFRRKEIKEAPPVFDGCVQHAAGHPGRLCNAWQ
jgi:hypothetical protein